MSRENAINDRLNARLTGPSGEAEFMRHAADDLEWAMGLLERVAEACEDFVEESVDSLADKLKEADERESRIEELEGDLEKTKEELAELKEEHKAAQKRIAELQAEADAMGGDAA